MELMEGFKIMIYGLGGTFLFAGFMYLIMLALVRYVKDKE